MDNSNSQVMQTDILGREEIRDVLTRFYERVFDDPIIGFFFTDIAKLDLQGHIDLITDFWMSTVFGEGSYQRNVMQKHLDLNDKAQLRPGHFTRWLYLFEKTIDANYSGTNADRMKKRANQVAEAISNSLQTRRGAERSGVDTLGKLSS